MLNKKEYDRKRYIENREEMLDQAKRWQKNNPKKATERSKRWARNNPEKVKEKNRRYYENNYEKILERCKQYRKNNPEKAKEWCEKNRGRIREKRIQRISDKRKMDLKFNLTEKIRRMIAKSLKKSKKGRHWESLVGYTLADLIKRLKKTKPKDYTWQDFLNGKLHIDHIVPLSKFNFTKSEHIDFKNCWALRNLRLLPAKENLVKSNKLEKPFQPSLKLHVGKEKKLK